MTVRRASAKALKLAGDPSVLPDLLQALINDKDPVVQGSAAAAMAIFGEEAVKHLLAILVSPTSTALQSGLATWGLSFIGAEAPNALREAAQSKNPSIKVSETTPIMGNGQSRSSVAKRWNIVVLVVLVVLVVADI